MPWGAVGRGGQQGTVGSAEKEERWNEEGGAPHASPERGFAQAEQEDGHCPELLPTRGKRARLQSITQTQCPPHGSRVQTTSGQRQTTFSLSLLLLTPPPRIMCSTQCRWAWQRNFGLR